MDYQELSQILKTEFPLNRKEQLYTATILPALLFHNGLKNFFTFLGTIKGFPKEINESNTGDSFLFYTEYTLKESAGERNVGRRIDAPTNDTPDVVIEILKPVKALIVIEGKMFENTTTPKIDRQIKRQRKYVSELLKTALGLEENRIFHIALVPKMLGILESEHFQVINWDVFFEDQFINLTHCYFYNYLKFALDNYDDLVSIWTGPDSTGEEIYSLIEEGQKFWIGRSGGIESLRKDVHAGDWKRRKYYTNPSKPKNGRKENWIQSDDFKWLLDDNSF